MKKILSSLLCLLFLCTSTAYAQFQVQGFKFEGLQRISAKSAETYLPIKRGQHLTAAKTSEVVKALYKTGFFERITLARSNNILIIQVVERPTIGQLKISGNSIIPTDKLTKVMKSIDVAEGRIYNPVILEKIKQSLLSQYYLLGRYNATVKIESASLPRNRVAVKLNISEGLVAKVSGIQIIGNTVYDEKTLIKQLELKTSGIFTFISQDDRYSEEKLEASLEKLRSWYMDRGYLHFEIKSSQSQVTPDRKSIFVTIVVKEGKPYKINSYQLEGKLLFPIEDLNKLVITQSGQTFSKEKILNTEKAITKYYGEKGYMFATVGLRPQVNDNTQEVILVYEVQPGKRSYIRHINFIDNHKTNDEVLRREIEQMESAPASTTQLEESKHRLALLPYIKNVDMSVQGVPDSPDEVDVNYKVVEDTSAKMEFKVGYSASYGMILGAGFNQKNFLGTGNTFGINFQRSKSEQYYGIDFTNPYYTPDGISRSFNLSISRSDPAGYGVQTGYTTHEYNAGVLYGIPLGQEQGVYNRMQVGFNYQNTLLKLDPSPIGKQLQPISSQLNDFVTRHGTHFQQLDLKLGFTRNSLDRAMMPTKGLAQTIVFDGFLPLTKKSLTYYTLNYSARWYIPLSEQFILLNKVNLGYANGINGIKGYPMYKNYFTGGIDSVRGFDAYTLGPKDSRGYPLGGNILTNGTLSIIFPNYISESLRTSVFVDAGNVYGAKSNRSYGFSSTDSGPIRYTGGIEVDWFSPFGPVELSLAKILNKQKGDSAEAFQFALGANF